MSSPIVGYLQAETYSAVADRLILNSRLTRTAVDGSLFPRAGVLPGVGAALKVTSVGGFALQVESGSAIVEDYTIVVPEPVTVTMADATTDPPHRDLIVLRVFDQEEGDDHDGAELQIIPGTGLTDPAVPARSMVLAAVVVGTSVASITPADVTDRRVFTASAGGTVQVTGQGGVVNPSVPAGTLIYDPANDAVTRKRGDGTTGAIGGYAHAVYHGSGTVYPISGTAAAVIGLPVNTTETVSINNDDNTLSLIAGTPLKIRLAKPGLYTIDWHTQMAPFNSATRITTGFVSASITWTGQVGAVRKDFGYQPQGSVEVTRYFAASTDLTFTVNVQNLTALQNTGGTSTVNVTHWG